MSNKDMFKNSIIIGAHPDDELLWFNAALPKVNEVLIVFRDFWAHPQLGEARTAAMANHPHQNLTCLNMAEAGTYGCANWIAPVCDDFGLEFSMTATAREVKRIAKRSLSKVVPLDLRASEKSVRQTYEDNFHELYSHLKHRLTADMNVFSHNPWGEYGHEDHVQVFRVLDKLRAEIGFKLWMSNYCTERALPLALRYFQTTPGNWITLESDKAYADKTAQAYKDAGCWTWADNWAWFDNECYLETPSAETAPVSHNHLFPLNMFLIDAPAAANESAGAVSKSAIGK